MASAAPSQAPSPIIAKLPSCQGAAILSAARGHAELRTKRELAQQPGSSCMGAEMPACPRPGQLCWASVTQVSSTVPHIWAGCPSQGHVPAYIMCLLRYPIPVCQQVHPALVPQCQGAGLADVPKASSRCQPLGISCPSAISLCSGAPATGDTLTAGALAGSRAGCLGLHGCWPVGSGRESNSPQDPLQLPLVSWFHPSHSGPDRPAQADRPLHVGQHHHSPLFPGTGMSL